MPKAEAVARFGGDEFVVTLKELYIAAAESIAQAHHVAEKLLAKMDKLFVLRRKQDGKEGQSVEPVSTLQFRRTCKRLQTGRTDRLTFKQCIPTR